MNKIEEYLVERIFRYLSRTTSDHVKFVGKKEGIECYPDASLDINDKRG
mgnify:CR=1 FL=1